MLRSLPVTLVAVALGVAAVGAAAVPAVRTPALQAAGRFLAVDDPLQPADVLVVAIDADAPGVLEAADLVRAGIAPRVAVFVDPPDSTDLEFQRRGVPYENESARTIRQLRQLGVSAVESIPRPVSGTEEEGRVLPAWCEQRGFHSIIVISNPDHVRRIRRVMRRAMAGRQTRVAVRASRYSEFDPDRWWETRAGVRTGIIEFQKLLLDWARHPLS